MSIHPEKNAGIALCEGNLFIISVLRAKGRVARAWSTGKMLHNMNYLLGARLSGEESFFAQRPHCLCNAGHALAATRALERLIGIRLPESARLARNIVHALQYLLDHLTHFYLFYSNDWLDLAAALRASPEKTAAFAREKSPSLAAGAKFYQEAQGLLAALAAGDGGTVFSVGKAGHPAQNASPEASLLVLSHIQPAMDIRTKLTRAQGILRGALAANATWHIGGLPQSASLTGGGNPDLSPTARAACAALLGECRQFIEGTFLPDVLLVGGIYKDWAAVGRSDAFLSWGEFPGPEGGDALFPGGVFTVKDAGQAAPASPDAVTDETDPGWAERDKDRYRLRFGPGETAYHWRNDDFRWFSAPRHAGRACEVGPVARIVGAYGRANAMVRELADAALTALGLPLGALDSVIGRVLARGIESVACIRSVTAWLGDLDRCLDAENPVLQVPFTLPDSGEGIGLAELTRGALVHRIRLRNRRIVAHEALVPSLWNFSPRSGDGIPGPLERALLDIPVADPANPLELLRVIHTFDPCNACVLRVEDADTGRVTSTNAK
ncbi:Cytochrome-c3 hydrogenase [Solidesulfovibrio fructosivorans JJ]]|uniref:Cytochrome-c3 hydrogenase n=1 Tax=Solidesulfovibrio fructosivorans JJ] TaxID=596151 RepID=E1JVJ9_SOLFR|nr:nickel-dependent hydrogenase large subunit [Solidesulfovibrio fructosivorans]EFL51487.1 Cytochrome-c3 hydrogenase [Solidesulfovibrio fructosivorans JJ]]